MAGLDITDLTELVTEEIEGVQQTLLVMSQSEGLPDSTQGALYFLQGALKHQLEQLEEVRQFIQETEYPCREGQGTTTNGNSKEVMAHGEA